MTEEIKKLLKEKFVELGGKLDIASSTKDYRERSDNTYDHINNILRSDTFTNLMKTQYGFSRFSLRYRRYLKGSPMGVAMLGAKLTNSVKITKTVTKIGKNWGKEVVTYEPDLDTSWLKGDAKQLFEEEIEKLQTKDKFKTKSGERKLTDYEKEYMRGEVFGNRKRSNEYVDTDSNNWMISIEFYQYIIFYKDVFALLTKDEWTQLLIDREASANAETIEELKTLTVESLNEMNEKKAEDARIDDLKDWLKRELKNFEDEIYMTISRKLDKYHYGYGRGY